jgi:hypothetical protein
MTMEKSQGPVGAAGISSFWTRILVSSCGMGFPMRSHYEFPLDRLRITADEVPDMANADYGRNP